MSDRGIPEHRLTDDTDGVNRTMATDALLRLEQTALFRRLTAREVEDGLGHELSERVKSIVDHVAPLMEWIPFHMPEFTLHDPNHGAKVVELMGRILPPDTLDALNSIECTCLLLAGYLHDIGMTCSPAERESIVRSNPQYDRIRRADPELQARFEEYQMSGNHRGATAVEDAVLTEFLRRTHVTRGAEYIRATLVQGDIAITVRGIAFHHWVIAICNSHALPVSALKDTMKWPRDALIRNFRLNVHPNVA